MKAAVFFLTLVLATCQFAQSARPQGGFREVLNIIRVEPASLEAIDPNQPETEDWQIVSQVVARLKQHETDLSRWTKPFGETVPEDIGELFEVRGTVNRVDKVVGPEGGEPAQLFGCHLTLPDARDATVLSVQVPRQWETGQPLSEPASFSGVLLRTEGTPLFLANHIGWHPREGLPLGKLLLARFGMDAALWDDVVQRTPFTSPERGREAQAFYAALSAISKVPSAELAALTIKSIADNAAAMELDSGTKQERQVAAAVVEQAAQGLSSVAPLFLSPQGQAGQLVRIEGTARRAVRIVADNPSDEQSIREYYELEVFTADSQNLPIVCLVSQLPAGFPEGDAIRAGVRVDGVFFKMWRYLSRKTTPTTGETGTQQSSYTPVIMAGAITWLKQATAPARWWGLAIGGIVFVLVIGGLLRLVLGSRTSLRIRKEETPDFSKLRDL